MKYRIENGFVAIDKPEDFNAKKIFECGQCFRWNMQEDGSWLGIARGKALRLFEDGGQLYFGCPESDFQNIWAQYFDLERDYGAARRRVSINPFMSQAAEFGKGIRILRQEIWETLCSFIISQCNNIGRIKGIVERLCTLCGDTVTYEGRTYHLFPSPERVAELEISDLECLRAGYRSEYILNAAREITLGRLPLDGLDKMATDEVLETLTRLKGVGIKVASCVALFGCGKMDAFPVDVWVRRAIGKHFGGKAFDSSIFGEDAGIAQQYIFFYIRNGLGS